MGPGSAVEAEGNQRSVGKDSPPVGRTKQSPVVLQPAGSGEPPNSSANLDLQAQRRGASSAPAPHGLDWWIGVTGGVATIVATLYVLLFGSRSVPDLVMATAKTLSVRLFPWRVVRARSHDASGQILLKVSYRLTCLDCNREGTRLAIGGFKGEVLLYDIAKRTFIQLATHGGIVRQVRFSPDGANVLSTGDDGLVLLTSVSAKEFRALGRHEGHAYDADFSPSGDSVTSVGADGAIAIWKIWTAALQPMGSSPSPPARPAKTIRRTDNVLFGIDCHPQQNTFAVCGAKGFLEIVAANRSPQTFVVPAKTLFSVAFSPGAKRLAVGGEDGVLRIFDVTTGGSQDLLGHGGPIRVVRFHFDGSHIVTGSKDRTVRIWNIDTGAHRLIHGHHDYVYGVAIHPQGSRCYAVGGDGTLRQWTLEPSLAAAAVAQQPS